MELSLAVTNSVADLIKKRIFCTEVFRIPLAGQVNMCCFDKTGTLTSDDMQLKGVRLTLEPSKMPCDKDGSNDGLRRADAAVQFTSPVEPNSTLPWSSLRVMAACHSLARNKGGDQDNGLIGDPLEKAILDPTGYKMINNNFLQRSDVSQEGRPETILILRRFGFSSKLKRMTVLCKESGNDCTWVLTKGAPETIKQFLRSETIPPDYDEISMHHMALGE